MQRHILTVIYLVVMVSCFITNHPGSAKKKGKGGLKGATKSKLPYCPIDKKISAYLKGIRSWRKTSRPKKKPKKLKRSRFPRAAIPFPYDCRHAALDFSGPFFDISVYKCCNLCEEEFHSCVSQNPSQAKLRCPSDALRCISKCTCNGPGQPGIKTKARLGRPGLKSPPSGTKSKPGRCPTKTIKRRGKSSCIQRSCIPI